MMSKAGVASSQALGTAIPTPEGSVECCTQLGSELTIAGFHTHPLPSTAAVSLLRLRTTLRLLQPSPATSHDRLSVAPTAARPYLGALESVSAPRRPARLWTCRAEGPTVDGHRTRTSELMHSVHSARSADAKSGWTFLERLPLEH